MSASFPSRFRFPSLARAWLALLLVAVMPAVDAAPRVAASIVPLQMIAAAVMDGAGGAVLALGAGQDPHAIALRPSERRAIADADVLLWVGPSLELPLAGVLTEHREQALSVERMEGIASLHQGLGIDPHLWLGLGNARVIARTLADRLVSLDTANEAIYRANLARFERELDDTLARSKEATAAIAPTAWAVYHQAFGYIEAELGLPPALTITDINGNLPGVRAMLATREAMRAAGLDCVVIEPGVDQANVRNVLDLPALRTVTLDILGLDQPVDAGAYVRMYDAVVNGLLDCAKGTPHD